LRVLYTGRINALCVDRLEDVEPFVPMPLPTARPANSALIPADALLAASRLEDYEIDCVIARSAVAMVYKALDRRNDQVVAIKEFLPIGLATRGADGQVAARETIHEKKFQRGRQIFLEQARALEKCEHASLMRVLRVIECHDTVYKVMPYCLGPTLLEFRQKMAAAPTERILRTWLEGLMGALAQLHDKGQLHGAVSPGNILMLPDDRPVLLDSNAVHAAILSDRTRSMIASLEPCFAPPEQCAPAQDRPLGPWTDLYALAATLRFSVSGELPGAFAQRSRGVPVESGAQRHVGAAEPAGADAPPWLTSLDACLAETGRDRPQSLTQLKKLLQVDGARSPATTPSASPATKVAEGVDPVDRATRQPDTGSSFSALASAESAQPTSSGARETARSRFRIAGIAVSLLAAIAATSIHLWKERSRSAPDATPMAEAAQLPAPPAQHAATSTIVPIADPRESVAQAELPPTGTAEAPASTLAVRPAAPSPPPGKPASKVEKPKPIAPTATSKPVAANSLTRASSPRLACAGRERYALLQCMNEQCAKSRWSRHEQCVRLRKERKL